MLKHPTGLPFYQRLSFTLRRENPTAESKETEIIMKTLAPFSTLRFTLQHRVQLWLMAFLIIPVMMAQKGSNELLREDTSKARSKPPPAAFENSARPVHVAVSVLNLPRFQVTVTEGETLWVERNHVTHHGKSDFVWSGKIAHEPMSRVTFAVRNGVVAGTIDRAMTDGNRLYELVSDGVRGGYWMVQMDESLIPSSYGDTDNYVGLTMPFTQKANELQKVFPQKSASPDDPIMVDLMMLYTPASRVRYGQAGIEARILAAVADANTVLINSEIYAQLNLVHMAEVNYTETGNMSQSLTALRSPSDGKIDEIHTWRDIYGADLVSMVCEDTNAAGMGYVMTSPSTAFAPYAFSVIYSTALTQLTLAHELAHNMGAQHNRESTSTGGAYPYSYGWRRSASDGTGFRTVLAAAAAGTTRINYYSNPNLSYAGHPIGVSYEENPAQSADNARTLNNTAPIVAAFRVAVISAPPAPSGVTATALSQFEVEVLWLDNSNTETGYHVERADGVESVFTAIATLATDTTRFADTTVISGETYAYRVTAFNSAGVSTPSNTAWVTAPEPPTPPVAPEALSATAVAWNTVDVHWNDMSGNEEGFVLERAQEGQETFTVAAVLPANATTYTDNSVQATTAYTYRVAAWNGEGVSDYSAEAATTTPSAEATPAAPSNLSGSALSTTSIRLNWNDNSSNETGFTVYRYSGSSWIVAAQVGAGVTTYTNTGLNKKTTYSFFVAAQNAAGSSPASNVVSVRTKTR